MPTPTLLYLTDAEKKAFSSLSEALREGWKTEDETLTYTDTQKNREMRFMITRFHDPKLLAVRDKFKTVKSDEEFLALMKSIDLGAISEADLGQITFALGPDAIGALILSTLRSADSDADLLMASNFSALRHELLESLTIAS